MRYSITFFAHGSSRTFWPSFVYSSCSLSQLPSCLFNIPTYVILGCLPLFWDEASVFWISCHLFSQLFSLLLVKCLFQQLLEKGYRELPFLVWIFCCCCCLKEIPRVEKKKEKKEKVLCQKLHIHLYIISIDTQNKLMNGSINHCHFTNQWVELQRY